MATLTEPDRDAVIELFAEIGLDADQILQWPTVKRRGLEHVLEYEVMSGMVHEVTISATWARTYSRIANA